MPLDADDLAIIESWTGSLDDELKVSAETRLASYEQPELVAYWLLRVRYGGMLHNPDEVRLEGDARIKWEKAKEDLLDQVRSLWNLIDGKVKCGDWVLGAEAAQLYEQGRGQQGGQRVTSSKYLVQNPRP